jgi:N-acetylmuramoyl-L-alanine amidase
MSDALVSLHCSVSRNPDRRGIRLYVVEGDLRSAALANRILKHLHRRFGSICRYRGVRWDTASDGRRLPLLRGLYRRMPAVHIDAGSLTNTVDAGLLNDRDFRQAWCKAVTDALTGM